MAHRWIQFSRLKILIIGSVFYGSHFIMKPKKYGNLLHLVIKNLTYAYEEKKEKQVLILTKYNLFGKPTLVNNSHHGW
jgi:hypothetical protein